MIDDDKAKLKTQIDDLHLNLIVVEVNGIGEPVIDDLLQKSLNVAPFLTTYTVKSHIVLGLKSALEHSKLAHFSAQKRCRILIILDHLIVSGAYE